MINSHDFVKKVTCKYIEDFWNFILFFYFKWKKILKSPLKELKLIKTYMLRKELKLLSKLLQSCRWRWLTVVGVVVLNVLYENVRFHLYWIIHVVELLVDAVHVQ